MPLMRVLLHLTLAALAASGLALLGWLATLEFRPILASWKDRRSRGHRRVK